MDPSIKPLNVIIDIITTGITGLMNMIDIMLGRHIIMLRRHIIQAIAGINQFMIIMETLLGIGHFAGENEKVLLCFAFGTCWWMSNNYQYISNLFI